MIDEDEGAARVFGALCDPDALRLLLHVLEEGESGDDAGDRLGMTPTAAALHLDRLVDAGVMVRTQLEQGTGLYRVRDALLVERLLATVRQVGTRRRGT